MKERTTALKTGPLLVLGDNSDSWDTEGWASSLIHTRLEPYTGAGEARNGVSGDQMRARWRDRWSSLKS